MPKSRFPSKLALALTPSLSPVQKVFTTIELLELILRHLRVPDIFYLQRVCRTWSEVLRSSPCLRQRLFLADPSATNADLQLNPFFLDMAPSWAVRNGTRYLIDWPALAWAHPRATWRKMMLFSPGAAHARIHLDFARDDKYGWAFRMPIEGHRGRCITLEDFLKALKKFTAGVRVDRKLRVDLLERVKIKVGVAADVTVYEKSWNGGSRRG